MAAVEWFDGLDTVETIEGLAELRVHVQMIRSGDEVRLSWEAPSSILSIGLKNHLARLRPKLVRDLQRRLHIARLCARLCDLGIGLSAHGESVVIEDTEGNLTDQIRDTVVGMEPHLARWLRGIPLPDESRALSCAPYLEREQPSARPGEGNRSD